MLLDLRLYHRLGISSLVCFNDEPIVRLTVPALTAVDIPAERMGKMAAELLVRHMNSEKPLPAERIVLKETLVVRESTNLWSLTGFGVIFASNNDFNLTKRGYGLIFNPLQQLLLSVLWEGSEKHRFTSA